MFKKDILLTQGSKFSLLGTEKSLKTCKIFLLGILLPNNKAGEVREMILKMINRKEGVRRVITSLSLGVVLDVDPSGSISNDQCS